MELNNKSQYKVTYSVKKAMNSHGEYSGVQDIHILNGYSDTNDLQEIFTDLFYLHREESIVGIEIECVESVLSAKNNSESFLDRMYAPVLASSTINITL